MPVSAGIAYLFQKLVLKRSDLAFSFCGASNSIVKNMLIQYQQRHRSNNGAKLPVHLFLNKGKMYHNYNRKIVKFVSVLPFL